MAVDYPEISDAIVNFDTETLDRRPVERQAVVDEFSRRGQRKAAAIVAQLPAIDGILDPNSVDAALLACHYELQQMSEEFFHGQRVLELLRPVIRAMQSAGISDTIRIVDVGCGIGYVIRWLAAKAAFPENVELTGADFNQTLVNEASRLAAAENLNCRFVVANAFRMQEAATVYLSTGVLHHFRGNALTQFFGQHERSETRAFAHFDFQPSIFAPIGSWFFHLVRMRLALARHDGVASACRAHSGETLLSAARGGATGFATGFATGLYGSRLWKLPIPRVMHTVFGIRPDLRDAVMEQLGQRTVRMGPLL